MYRVYDMTKGAKVLIGSFYTLEEAETFKQKFEGGMSMAFAFIGKKEPKRVITIEEEGS